MFSLSFWIWMGEFWIWFNGKLEKKSKIWHFFFFKGGLSPSKKIYLLHWKHFKNDEKCFLFHLKSFSHSQGIQVFVLTFWSCREYSLIRKVRLISKFMLQPGLQTITIHMLPNILRSKHNQTMKLGQLIEYKKRNIFSKIMQKMRQGN